MSTASELEIKRETIAMLASAGERYGLKIVEKRSSKLMKLIFFLSLMRFWNPDFLTKYVTTIGRVMYVPKPAWQFGQGSIHDYVVLHHELQHIKDSIHWGSFWWSLFYLFPQSLSLLALGAFWDLRFLFALVFLLPWPAPFRVHVEARGYAVGLAARARWGQPLGTAELDGLRGKFIG